MEFKKHHRRYPDSNWDYKAISTTIFHNGKMKSFYYYTLIQNGKKSNAIEVYSGRNYIVGSNDNSYSRGYEVSSCPQNYLEITEQLIKEHNKTKWSKEKYVNFN